MTTDRKGLVAVFSVVFALYGALQWYVVAQVRAALALAWPATAALAVWAAVMTAMPVMLRAWERRHRHRTVWLGAWVAYTWMGAAFLYFWVSLAVQAALLLVRPAGHEPGWGHGGFWPALGLTACVTLYGIVSARRLRVERVSIPTSKLSPGSTAVRIAVISDLHLGALVGRRRLGAVLNRIRTIDPDMLVSAGDLLDGQADDLDDMAAMLAEYRPSGGKYAVTGNHEYFFGLGQALVFHDKAGFRMLRGDAVQAGAGITLAGVDDPTGMRLGQRAYLDERRLLDRCPSDRFTILLKHQPRIDRRAAGRFDLQISGHVHKGQIFPFGLIVRLFYPRGTGLSQPFPGGRLYVSRGTGTWGPPMRVGAAPEITLIEVRAAGTDGPNCPTPDR